MTIETDPAAAGSEVYDHALSICRITMKDTNKSPLTLFTAPPIEGSNYIMGIELYSKTMLVESW